MAYMAQMRNPNPRGSKRFRKEAFVLPDLDIFKKVSGVAYFNPEEWHSFPFEYKEAVFSPRKKKGGDDE